MLGTCKVSSLSSLSSVSGVSSVSRVSSVPSTYVDPWDIDMKTKVVQTFVFMSMLKRGICEMSSVK